MNTKEKVFVLKAGCNIGESVCQIALSYTNIKEWSDTICSISKGICYGIADAVGSLDGNEVEISGANASNDHSNSKLLGEAKNFS